MTNKERLVALTILVSVLGFAFISAINPIKIAASYTLPSSFVAPDYSIHVPYSTDVSTVDTSITTRYELRDDEYSRMVSMVSIVLDIDEQDVEDAFNGGVRPAEMLASSGVLLSDLSEQFNFELVGERELVRFRV